MNYEFIEVVREGALTIVTINRPASHNALHSVSQRELAHAFDAFAEDDTQWVAIVTGKGDKAFCAGHDLKLEPVIDANTTPPEGFGGLAARTGLTKPVIAAVNGIAMGGGFELALACDLIIASGNAIFALPEPRVGLAALAGGIQRLPQAIGLKQAMGMLLTGRRVSAEEAQPLGFVNEIAERDALSAARVWAKSIIECSPMAVRATKDAALRALGEPLERTLREIWTYPAMGAMLASQDAIEGPAAFAEKRPPVWVGK